MSFNKKQSNALVLRVTVVITIAIITYQRGYSAQTIGTTPTSPGGWQWTSIPWTGDDKPYTNIETTIDTELANHEPYEYFQKKYHKVAQQNPADPLAQFADAYANWKQLNLFRRNFADQTNLMQMADLELARTPDPHTYSYTRLRFLIEANLHKHVSPMRLVGERLLAKDPADDKVKYWLVEQLSSSTNYQMLALRYLADLLRDEPGNPNIYASVGNFYWHRVYRTHSKEDANKAVAAWRKYLELAPQDDSYRVWANHAIQDIQTEMAKHG